jgi:hypothetical protein
VRNPASLDATETAYRHVIVPAIQGGGSVMDDVFGDEDATEDNSGQAKRAIRFAG